jgi:hypothetical protein
MSTDPLEQSGEDVAKEVFKPIEELLAKEVEELKEVDEVIHEAERKAKPVLDPEP